jgi:hypothetical protein
MQCARCPDRTPSAVSSRPQRGALGCRAIRVSGDPQDGRRRLSPVEVSNLVHVEVGHRTANPGIQSLYQGPGPPNPGPRCSRRRSVVPGGLSLARKPCQKWTAIASPEQLAGGRHTCDQRCLTWREATAGDMPDYQWLTVQYPYGLSGDWGETETVQLAKEMAPRVLAMRTT